MSRTINGHDAAARLTPAEPAHADTEARLPGRAELNAAILRLLRQPGDAGSSLALLQLANFYEIRTWVGRSGADRLLREITDVIARIVPPGARLYRCERFELALLLTPGGEEARLTGVRVCHALDTATFRALPPHARLHCAVGLVQLNETMSRPAIALARARDQLAGRIAGARGRQAPPSLPARVLREGRLRLNLQPVVDLRGRDPALYELRSGLAHDGGWLNGDSLHALAQQHSLGEALDHLVLQRALRLLAKTRTTRLLVNVGLDTLVSEDFHNWLAGRLTREAAAAGRLELQIGEADALVAQHHLGPFSESLRALQVPLGIRGFGGCEEPLGYLPLMRTDFVRLDRSRTDGLGDDRRRREALETLVAALRGKGIRVIAGLVEDAGQLPLLWAAGIHRMQGNCLQPPVAQARFRFPRLQVEH